MTSLVRKNSDFRIMFTAISGEISKLGKHPTPSPEVTRPTGVRFRGRISSESDGNENIFAMED